VSLLRTLYALAIALLVVAFVGFGISAFYPEPEFPQPPPELEYGGVGENPTEEEKQMLAEEQKEMEAYQERLSDYNRVVAFISIGLAVVLLVGSLLWISGVPVIGDGVTLGAVFTLFYGLIRALMTQDERIRFVAVAVGLVVVLALVYWRFIRSREGRA
jgi:hypothetical protein